MLGQWRARRRARAPGWGERTPRFLCVSARATLPVRRQITARARAWPAFPGPPGPSPGCAGRPLPVSPRLPLASAGLSLRPLPPSLFLRAHRLGCRQTSALSLSLTGGGLRGWGCGVGGKAVPGWPQAVRGEAWCLLQKRLTLPPASPLPLPLLQSIKNISRLAVRKKDAPRMLHLSHRAGDREAKRPILGPRPPSPEWASEASVPPWPPELAWVVI